MNRKSFFLAFAMFLTSCASFNLGGAGDFLTKSLPYVEPASYFATATIINSTKEERRQEVAENIFATAASIRSLSSGVIPTPKELENVIKVVGKNPDQNWINFVSSLSSIYENLYLDLQKTDDSKLALDVLGKLAGGCERAARPYVPSAFLMNYKIKTVAPFVYKLRHIK